MRKSIVVNIPEPCHEDWNKMTPKDKGRHCAVCTKTVIDFTNQTDEQIIKAFDSNNKLCGRFKNQQLNREIVLTRKEKNNFRSWVASGLFTFLAIGSQKSNAQTEPIKIVQNDTVKSPQIKGKVAHSILNQKTISGVVTAKSDDIPLPGVKIKVKGSEKEIFTDFDGKYKLKVKHSDTLLFTYSTMKSIEFPINKNKELNIAMEDDFCSLDYIVAGYVITSYSKKSKCKRQKRKEKQAVRKKERLLQKKSKNND